MKNELIKNHIISPALVAIGAHTDDRVDMVFVTGATETLYRYNRQINGSALSWFQIERKTHDDLFRFLDNSGKNHILDGLLSLTEGRINFGELEVNPWYAAACCAVRYMYDPSPLPEAGMIAAQAETWKRVYNTADGRGTVGEFMERVTEINSRGL